MKALRAWEGRSGRVVRVRAVDHPPLPDAGAPIPVFAVFEEEAGRPATFRGLVSARKAAAQRGRIFADLLGGGEPRLFPAAAPLTDALQRMEAENLDLLPLADRQGLFAGALSRESALAVLFDRERRLRERTRRLQSLLERKNRALELKVKQLFHGLEAGKKLLDLLARPAGGTIFYEEGLQALTALVRCRYGAVGILDEAGSLQGFFVTGIAPELAAKIGDLPTGKGLLGLVLRQKEALRLEDMSRHPLSQGFPPFHPEMRSLLAVPIVGQQRILGRIYLCEKMDGEPFDDEDERLVRSFAASLANLLDHLASLDETARLQDQVFRTQKMDALGRLAGGMAHDFNNFLTVILANAEALLETLPAESSIGRKLDSIRTAADKASSLTRQLLSFGQRSMVHTVPVDLNACVRAVEDLLRGSLGAKVSLTLKLAPDLDPVRADALQMDQVLLNLALNARDAMREGGEVTIRTERLDLPEGWECRDFRLPPGTWTVLSFQDNGPGMDTETQARVFEPFFTTKEKGMGSGLGLSAVHGIIRQFGGSVDVKGDKGNGTTFTIFLPSCGAAAEPATGGPEHHAALEGGGTVLVVDDDEQVLVAQRRLLEQAGWSVISAHGGAEAVAQARDPGQKIDLFLLDLVMPGMGGRQVAEEILALRPDARIIFCSGYPGDSFDADDLEALGGRFLPKPFSSRAFTLRAREALAANPARTGPRSTALVIDDDPEVRGALAGILTALGFRVLEAGNGKAGLEILEREGPALVFCDLVMPEADGIEVCREIRKSFPGTRVVAMSGAAGGTDYLEVAAMLGAARTIEKPFRKDEILRAVQAVSSQG